VLNRTNLLQMKRSLPWLLGWIQRRSAAPDPQVAGPLDQQHVRMFVLSHLCGPFIGLALSAFLALLGFPLDYRLHGFIMLVCLFWCYPLALSRGAPYRLLSFASLQHLTFVILWASHGYGGVTSPFLLWLAIVPLLAFLYSPPGRRPWLILLAMLGLNIGLFGGVTLFVSLPPAADPHALRWLAALSLLCASAYVSMMAIYFGRVLSSRNEMAQEAAHRRALATELDRRATDLRHIRACRIASLSRLARGCRSPIGEILSSCRSAADEGAPDRSASDASDLSSIQEAARHLGELIDAVEEYSAALTGGLSKTAGSPSQA
jgi:hypothetical protein